MRPGLHLLKMERLLDWSELDVKFFRVYQYHFLRRQESKVHFF